MCRTFPSNVEWRHSGRQRIFRPCWHFVSGELVILRALPTAPAAFFSIVLGLAGLGNAWTQAQHAWGAPNWPGELLEWVAFAVWVSLTVLYIAKWIARRAEALAEFRDPIQCCFVGLFPVSGALVALPLRGWAPATAWALAVTAIAVQLLLGVFRTGALWKGGRDPAVNTPILYLLVVAGSFVSATVLGEFGQPEWGELFFGAGVLSWLAIESVLMHRLYVGSELLPLLRPTLGVQLAPPAVGCVAYQAISVGPPDRLVQALIGYALLQALLLMRLIPWISRQPFGASYWAFTFGATALPAAMIRYVDRGGSGPIAYLAPYVFAISNILIGGFTIGTLWQLATGKLLTALAAAAPSKMATTSQ
jgi:tellurite resistance protein